MTSHLYVLMPWWPFVAGIVVVVTVVAAGLTPWHLHNFLTTVGFGSFSHLIPWFWSRCLCNHMCGRRDLTVSFLGVPFSHNS